MVHIKKGKVDSEIFFPPNQYLSTIHTRVNRAVHTTGLTSDLNIGGQIAYYSLEAVCALMPQKLEGSSALFEDNSSLLSLFMEVPHHSQSVTYSEHPQSIRFGSVRRTVGTPKHLYMFG